MFILFILTSHFFNEDISTPHKMVKKSDSQALSQTFGI